MLAVFRVLAPNPGPFTLEGTNTWIVGRGPSAVIDPVGRIVKSLPLGAENVLDSGLPLVWRREGLAYRGASDEHGAIEIAAGAQAPSLGEKLYLVPGHCDPTVNLYDWYVCVRNGSVESVWSVTARGALN